MKQQWSISSSSQAEQENYYQIQLNNHRGNTGILAHLEQDKN